MENKPMFAAGSARTCTRCLQPLGVMVRRGMHPDCYDARRREELILRKRMKGKAVPAPRKEPVTISPDQRFAEAIGERTFTDWRTQ